MTKGSFKSLLNKAKQRDSYWAGKAIHEFTEDLFVLMEARGVSKAELARRMGSSPAYVTKALRGDTNFTIDSMVRLVRALDGQLSIHATREEDDIRWFDVVGKATAKPVPREDEFQLVSKHTMTKQTQWKAQGTHDRHTVTA